MELSVLNGLPPKAARQELLRCCGSIRWSERMEAGRPYADKAALLAAAERVWWALEAVDWLEAFSHHPRIGQKKVEAAWAKQEQDGVKSASQQVLQTLAERNHAYERRFGHIFLVCATGKSADQMLALLDARMGNDSDAELRVAAGEQAKITAIRLTKLLEAA
ncbi:2-oxo-4-hydroxy-4-carboxy-5-ureidoimidazoline decarboxylase [bacterium]|nr:MAG: 2-oxo-4-hydroxy-4-carboxy-5-ureidoimidazoline decarboxylase [bacterium]